jgi:hypothetical protein
MSGYVLIVCCLVVTRWWWLAARDMITERPRTWLLDRTPQWVEDGLTCPFCSSMWWAVPVVVVAWHTTPVEGAWFVWQPAAVLICSLVCATYVHVMDSLDP